jgi:2-polyprenyl-3-methyl-5-hydroxy-6-metoxy-1,4-benzoquinol methylase
MSSDKSSQSPDVQSVWSCYICNHTEFKKRKGMVRDDPSIQIFECVNCSLVALSSIKHIQADHYADGQAWYGLPSVEAWLKETKEEDQRRYEMLKATLFDQEILDFGCGAAGFLNKARSLARKVEGVEPEHRVREYWGDKIKINDKLEEVEGKFDLITAFHVIEHLPDPRKALNKLSEHLKENGRMVVEVPSSEDVLLTLYGNEAFQRFTFWSQHLYLFNAETLRRLAEQSGLRVVSIQQHQRYPLSNHIYWLSRNIPGGHQRWSFIDTPALTEAYAASLAAIGKCDTLVAYLERDHT